MKRSTAVAMLITSCLLFPGTRIEAISADGLSVSELEQKIASNPKEFAWIHGLRRKAEGGDKEAVQALKRSFEKLGRADTKREVGKVLLRLGQRDGKYWALVEAPAKARIESDMPTPTAVDSDGHFIRGKFSEEFLEWCKVRGVKPEAQAQDALYGAIRDVRELTESSDPRAIPLLVEGLASRNSLVVTTSAEGLAKFQHKPAVPAIIAACERLPKQAASSVAQFLVFFNDKDAQAAAAKYVTDSQTLQMRKRQAAKYGASGIGEKF